MSAGPAEEKAKPEKKATNAKKSAAKKEEKTGRPPRERLFWSRARGEDQRYLSTFTKAEGMSVSAKECAASQTLVAQQFEMEGEFDSIEGLFQAAKFHCLLPQSTNDQATKELRAGGVLGHGPSAKSAGSTKAFRSWGMRLDSQRWTKIRYSVMLLAVAAVDARYKKLLEEALHGGWRWVHVEPRKSLSKLFWGGKLAKDGSVLGPNLLGAAMHAAVSVSAV